LTVRLGELGMDTIMKGETEVRRLHELKAQMRGKLMEEARDTILRLWEETNASQAQRASFTGLNVTDEAAFSDELLQAHDDEIAVLQVRLDQMRPILGMIEKREAVVAERAQYGAFGGGRGDGRGEGIER
jgi:protein regulator of cytokinesis 1